jgi:hypothetical protein
MIVRISEVDAHSNSGPLRPAFQHHPRICKVLLPVFKFLGRDREGYVHWARAILWRDRAARRFDWLKRATLGEEEQNTGAGHGVGPHSMVTVNAQKAENALVESGCSIQIGHVQRGLKNADQLGHRQNSSPVPY